MSTTKRYVPYGTYVSYNTPDSPRTLPPTTELGTDAFRKGLAEHLDTVQHRGHRIVVTYRDRRRAALVSVPALTKLEAAERAESGYSNTARGTGKGEFLTRDELALDLEALSNQLGGTTVQLSAGEAAAVAALLRDAAGSRQPADALSLLCWQWADRITTRRQSEG